MILVKPLHQVRRTGAVLPMVTICLIALIGCTALAVDIGQIADARTELQDHVDAAVLAAVRELDGVSVDNNKTVAETTANNIVAQNRVFGKLMDSAATPAGNVKSLQMGVYRYDTVAKTFAVQFTAPTSTENYGAAKMELQMDQPLFFARIVGMTKQTITTTATAVHRPRDLGIILDFSGSMTFGSRNSLRNEGGGSFGYDQGNNRFSQNADPNFPRFGPWSIYPKDDPAAPSGGALPISPMQSLKFMPDSSGYSYGPANISATSFHGPPIVNDFTTLFGGSYDVKAWMWNIPAAPPPPPIVAPPTAPAIVGYLPLDLTNPTVMPAPNELANQRDAGWVDYTSTYGDKFPLRVPAYTAAPAGLDANPADFARNARDYVNFVIGLAAGDPRKFPAGTTVGVNTWSDGTDGRIPKTGGTDFTGAGVTGVNLHHLGFHSFGYGQNFKGYTMGPGYYGKTFYMWPPDPRTPSVLAPPAQGVASTSAAFYQWGDWRKRFFNNAASVNIDDDIWNSSGTRVTVATSYVNYNAILAWIKSGPKVFPDNLRCGRVLYYASIPNSITGSPGAPAPATLEERFWKEYIDYVVGAGSYAPDSRMYGQSPSNTHNGQNYGTPVITIGTLTTPYRGCYTDIPIHPRAHFWFGPMTMVDFMLAYTGGRGGTGMMPGSCHEAQTWQLKAGVQSALDDIKKNHPNDRTSLIYFSDLSAYATPRAVLTDQYDNVKKFLWYPFQIGGNPPSTYLSTATNEIYPYTTGWASSGTGNIPRGEGGTCPEMGFKVAFNQFSANASAPAGGGTGRIGANKTVIFETDGVPNVNAGGTFNASTPNNSYYSGTIGTASGTTIAFAASETVAVVTNMRNTTNGFGTRAKVHSIAFGDLMELPLSAAGQTGLNFLADVQNAGGTGMVGTGAARSIQSFKIIRGPFQTRIDNLRTAFESIMQGDVQLALID